MPDGSPTALVTGARGGIGAAFCALLGQRGPVVELDLPDFDVRSADAWQALQVPPLDVVVHCAGVSHAGRLADVTPQQLQSTVQVNLLGPMLGCQALRLNPGARVVFVGSMLGAHGVPGGAAYSASKAGLRAFAEAFQLENPGLEVVHLQPGVVDTPMAGDLPGDRLDPAVVAQAGLTARGLHVPVGGDAKGFVWLARWLPGLLRRRLNPGPDPTRTA